MEGGRVGEYKYYESIITSNFIIRAHYWLGTIFDATEGG